MNILLNIEPHALIADSGLGLGPVIVAIVAVFLFVVILAWNRLILRRIHQRPTLPRMPMT